MFCLIILLWQLILKNKTPRNLSQLRNYANFKQIHIFFYQLKKQILFHFWKCLPVEKYLLLYEIGNYIYIRIFLHIFLFSSFRYNAKFTEFQYKNRLTKFHELHTFFTSLVTKYIFYVSFVQDTIMYNQILKV